MKRLSIVILNLILIIVGFITIYYRPWSALAITIGMLLIAISIINFALLIYFPPPQQKYIKLKVVEESKIPKTPLKAIKPRKRVKKKKPKKKRPKKKKKAKRRRRR
ncbi:MAG: hypothetical protein GTN40_02885 [Candidatus Aenigmarchaeota archaeon]|nr:hypothetical protein [Candidatus Aenigmarchaeota archaeon]